jgi:hypothetical protein
VEELRGAQEYDERGRGKYDGRKKEEKKKKQSSAWRKENDEKERGNDERKTKTNLNPTRRLSAVHGAARGEGRETAVTSGCFEPLCVCVCVC